MSKEYIEREALKEDLKESYERLRAIYDGLTYDEDKQICAGQLTTFTEAILRVKEASAADVAPVVRCKDCRWRGREDCAMFYRCECGEQHTWETDNDFCSYGERIDT